MTTETATIRGQVMIRPWRVGLLVDTSSAEEVRAAIANLSSVWGGASMPIIDINESIAELEKLGRAFDVDSLYADVRDGPLGEFLRLPGWAWRGRGPWGPFGGAKEGSLRKGLLPTRALLDPSTNVIVPTWDAGHELDLVFAATWGIVDGLGWPEQRKPYSELIGPRTDTARSVGAVSAGMLHLRSVDRESFGSEVMVVRPDHPQDAVEFWNRRAYGDEVVAVPSDGDLAFAAYVLASKRPRRPIDIPGSGRSVRTLEVAGLEHASEGVAALIRQSAERDGLTVRPCELKAAPLFVFPGLQTQFIRSIRVETRPEARWVDIDFPTMPIVERENAYRHWRGIVAAEVAVREVHGLDPRFTSWLPPFRRHSALIENLPDIHQARVGADVLVLGTQAGAEDLRVPFAFNLDVMRLLFDAPTRVDQSDVGKFQTRASEKFGGPYTGTFMQPGVRAAVMLTARRAAGVNMAQLRNVVEKERGAWPDSLMLSNVTPREYAIDALNGLFNAGLFVPTVRVHCSYCRVESYVSAGQLASVMQCEFCGRSYSLALSHSLAQPEWRYRLAGHLRADQVEALMPALATTSLLAQFRISQEPSPLVLGLKVQLDGREIEVDVASYLTAPEGTAVLGEVKTANRVDAHDVDNLEFLRERLRAGDVNCILLFATLKEAFSSEEQAVLRALVERSTWTRVRGTGVPNVPLVLTGPDLSRTYWDEEHPWHWEKRNHAGLFDTAMVSCERNLGLRGYSIDYSESEPSFVFEWDDQGVRR